MDRSSYDIAKFAERFIEFGQDSDKLCDLPDTNVSASAKTHLVWRKLRNRKFRFAKVRDALSDGKNVDLTAAELVACCTDHKEAKRKGGEGITQCSLLNDALTRNRKKNIRAANVDQMSLMILDCDSGQSAEQATNVLVELGIAHIVYSSYSNGKCESKIPYDALMKHVRTLGKDHEPTLEDASNYLLEKRKFVPDIARSCEEMRLTAARGGPQYHVTHQAVQKFRIVIFLEEPFPIFQPGKLASENIAIWKSVYVKVCEEFGIIFDTACANVDRLHYLPQHPPGGNHFAYFKEGGTLDLAPYIQRVIEEADRNNARKDAEANKSGSNDETTQVLAAKPDGTTISLNKWMSAGGKLFRIADAIRGFDPDIILIDRDENKLEVVCPFDDQHSEPERTGFFVKSPNRTVDESWSAGCLHDGCSHLGGDRLLFLKGLLERSPGVVGSLGE